MEEKKKKKMYKLTCHDVGVDCDVEFLGENFDEIMEKAAQHAAAEHNLPIIPPNIKKKCLASLREVEVNEQGKEIK